jgi:hypothetical protein
VVVSGILHTGVRNQRSPCANSRAKAVFLVAAEKCDFDAGFPANSVCRRGG